MIKRYELDDLKKKKVIQLFENLPKNIVDKTYLCGPHAMRIINGTSQDTDTPIFITEYNSDIFKQKIERYALVNKKTHMLFCMIGAEIISLNEKSDTIEELLKKFGSTSIDSFAINHKGEVFSLQEKQSRDLVVVNDKNLDNQKILDNLLWAARAEMNITKETFKKFKHLYDGPDKLRPYQKMNIFYEGIDTRNSHLFFLYLREADILRYVMPELYELDKIDEDSKYCAAGSVFDHILLSLKYVAEEAKERKENVGSLLKTGLIYRFIGKLVSAHTKKKVRHTGKKVIGDIFSGDKKRLERNFGDIPHEVMDALVDFNQRFKSGHNSSMVIYVLRLIARSYLMARPGHTPGEKGLKRHVNEMYSFLPQLQKILKKVYEIDKRARIVGEKKIDKETLCEIITCKEPLKEQAIFKSGDYEFGTNEPDNIEIYDKLIEVYKKKSQSQ